jgi:cytochrome P450
MGPERSTTMSTTAVSKPIPSLRGEPFWGSMARLNKDRLGFLQEVVRQSGDVGSFRLGPVRTILINAPHLIQAVLVEHGASFGKTPPVLRSLRLMIGENLLTLEGDPHRRHRKLMAPALTPRHIAGYAGTMVDYAARVQQAWADGGVIDLVKESTALTMSIGGKTLFDIDVFDETSALGAAIANNMAYLNYLISHFITPPLWWPTPRHRRARATIALVNQRVHAMIAERRGAPDLNQRSDLLSRLVQARGEDGTGLSDQEVFHEALTVFAASHETTAKTLAWTLYELARHPPIAARVQAELDTVLQGRTPRYSDLPRLPYTLQVIKEALRLYPPAYVISRQALRDVMLDGYRVAKGTAVFLCVYTMHRRPDLYPQPETFAPERFSAENERRLPRHAYLPFGAGAHICLGGHFALMELHLVLATWLQRHGITLMPGQTIEPAPAFVLQPARAIMAITHRRR